MADFNTKKTQVKWSLLASENPVVFGFQLIMSVYCKTTLQTTKLLGLEDKIFMKKHNFLADFWLTLKTTIVNSWLSR